MLPSNTRMKLRRMVNCVPLTAVRDTSFAPMERYPHAADAAKY